FERLLGLPQGPFSMIEVAEADTDLAFDPAELDLGNPIGMPGVQWPHLPQLNPKQENVVQTLKDQPRIARPFDAPQAPRDQTDPLFRVSRVAGVKSFGDQGASGVMEVAMPAIQPVRQVEQAERGGKLAPVAVE